MELDNLDLDAVAKRYKEETGYVNLLGGVRENLESLWPHIKAEIEKNA